MDGEELKSSFMEKRSQGKSTLRMINYKYRFFVLTPKYLKYFDGTVEKGKGKEKGQLELSNVKLVEKVDDYELDGKKNVFQIVYKDGQQYTLYVVATSADERNDWIMSLREECVKNNAEFYDKFHTGAWSAKHGRFSCCDQKFKKAPGCRPAFQHGNSPNATNPPNMPLPAIPAANGTQPKNKSKQQPQKTVIALYDFESVDEQDLSLVKGEQYTVLDDSREHWWLAKNESGQKGYIPANYVEVSEGLEKYDWYYKGISRGRCEAILKEEGKEGCFLVRDSATNPGMYTLSLFTKDSQSPWQPKIIHYHILVDKDTGHVYFSQKHAFPNIPDLIFYHKHNSAGLAQRLRSPPGQSASPPTAGFGHDKWEIDPNRLQLQEELGRGQFGTVRKGIMNGNTLVAVKMMKEGSMSEDDFIEEARVMQSLQNSNLVQLYGVCTQKPIYIVTEYMKHGSLLQYLRKAKHRLFGKVGLFLDMCVQICSGMKFLESKSFIHRDLAARNCLVGSNNSVKVADFGLTRFVLDDQYTSSGGAKFPIKWSPPEVLNFLKFSSKSDVWAFGVLMWEVFTCGDMPYGRMTNQEVVEYVVNKRRRMENPLQCPSQVYKVMMKCWAERPEQRPSFEALLPDIEAFLDRDYAD